MSDTSATITTNALGNLQFQSNSSASLSLKATLPKDTPQGTSGGNCSVSWASSLTIYVQGDNNSSPSPYSAPYPKLGDASNSYDFAKSGDEGAAKITLTLSTEQSD